MSYKLNFVGLVTMAAAIVILAGVLGGTLFERGVAGLLVMNAGDIAELTLTSSAGWVKYTVMALMPIAMGVYAWGVILMLAGLS